MSFLDEVKNIVRAWIDESPKRGLSMLSRKSGVPYSTLRRLVQDEIIKVKLEAIIPVLNVCLESNELIALLAKHDPNWASIWENLIHSDAKFLKNDEEGFEVEWHDIDNDILALAGTSQGVSRERIKAEYGSKGLERAELLWNSNILSFANDRFQMFADEWSDPNMHSVLRRIELSARNYRFENVGEGAAYARLSQEGDEDAIRDCVKMLGEVRGKIINRLKASTSEKTKVFTVDLLANFVDKDLEK